MSTSRSWATVAVVAPETVPCAGTAGEAATVPPATKIRISPQTRTPSTSVPSGENQGSTNAMGGPSGYGQYDAGTAGFPGVRRLSVC